MKTAGKVMPRLMGEYEASTTYDILDIVSHAGTWICKLPNTVGIEPTEVNSDNWMLLVKGSDGVLDEIKNELSQTKSDLNELKTFVTPQMFGAKGDGVTDDTEAIQNALNASDLVYIPDGTYMINGTYNGYAYSYNGGIKPNSGQKIIMSPNAKLKAIANSNGFYNIVNLFQKKDVYITGGKIEGDKEYHASADNGGEHGHCIAMRCCDNITIDNVECFNGWGDSIDVGKGGIDNCKNIRIYNCKLHDSRRQGISVTGVIGLVVRDCDIYNIGGTAPQYGIDIEPDDSMGVAENIVIDSCRIVDNVGGSIVVAPVDNSIKNIRITNCITNGIMSVKNTDGSIVLEGNTIEHLHLGANNATVSNCDIEALLPAGGSGTFNNCRFKSETASGLIVEDLSSYPNKISEYLNFNGCTFNIVKDSQYLFNGKVPTSGYVDKQLAEKLLKFAECRIDLIGASSRIFNRFPEKVVFDGCDIISSVNQNEMFTMKNVNKGVKLVINNTTVTSPKINYLIGVDNHSDFEIAVYNSKFSTFRYLLYCNSGGNAGGNVRLFNNIMSNTNIYNTNVFNLVVANNPITKVSELENDAGYLKSFTETDPTVPSWAKSATKPTYTASEVGALPSTTTIPSKTSQLTNDSGFLTQHQSLSGYAKTVDHYTKTESDNKYQTKGNYLTSVPSEYVTETELSAKGYLTSHQDISGKADKSSAETWTFTLADGSTVTKKVVLA